MLAEGKIKKYRDTYKPAPARALNAGGGGVELLLEGVEGAEGLDDGALERAILETTTVTLALGGSGREVLPEERVVDVAFPNHKCEKRLRLPE